MTFEIPEEMEWATYDASRVWQISKGGGHNFTAEVTAVGDNGSYDYDSMIFYVSEKVDKNEFHNASNYIKGTAETACWRWPIPPRPRPTNGSG